MLLLQQGHQNLMYAKHVIGALILVLVSLEISCYQCWDAFLALYLVVIVLIMITTRNIVQFENSMNE
jgi:hypothetical protein